MTAIFHDTPASWPLFSRFLFQQGNGLCFGNRPDAWMYVQVVRCLLIVFGRRRDLIAV
jgi:hypothetical protein